MKIHKVVKIFIQISVLFFSFKVLADFGDSCSILPATSDKYLEQDAAYSYLISNIDMKTYIKDGCNPTDPQFKFCLKNQDGTSPPCKSITLNLGDSKSLYDLSKDNPELGGNRLLKDIILTVKLLDNDLCLTMSTSRGKMPVACKTTNATPLPILPNNQCRNIGKTCYTGTVESQSLFNFSGLAVDCLQETLNRVFYQYNSCNSQDDNISLTTLNPFPLFQESLKVAIRAALILYTIFFAVNMVLNKDYGNLDKIAVFVIKLLLVAYFSVGLGPVYFQDGKKMTENGMMKYGLPLLTGVTSNLAQIVFNSSGSKGLCEFDIEKYKRGHKFYVLWDAIDCRIGYYFGMGLMYNAEALLNNIPNTIFGGTKGNAINSAKSNNNTPNVLDQAGSLRFFTVLFGFLLSGNIIIFISGLIFSIIFVSIVLQFITSYLVCLITIYVMIYISPIFIPMALFTRTASYFAAWLKITLSCTLQPAVIAGFIALLLTMYDTAIYKNCQFMRHDYIYQDNNFSTFELRLPDNEPEQCKNSAGYKLLEYYSGQGWAQHHLMMFPVQSIQDILSLCVELLYVLVFSIIFYYFSKSISQFAADITSGSVMNSVTASPTKIVDLVKKGAKIFQDSVQARGGKLAQLKGQIDKKR